MSRVLRVGLSASIIFVLLLGACVARAQDLARGKPTEIEHLNGFVVKKGTALGVPTPVNHTLLALVKLLEKR